MASTYAGSSTAARRSWDSKKPKPTLLGAVQGLVQQYGVPVAVLGFLVRRYLLSRKQDTKKADAKASAAKATPAETTRKPRRDYKVKRDQDAPLLVGADDEAVEVQPHDNVMEAYDEAEVDKAGAAAPPVPGGSSNTQMLQMLQQMGYRVIMPKDGSGQVFLVPPGAQGPGGQAIEEGDEEGYDEDEEGYEEGEEEEEDE